MENIHMRVTKRDGKLEELSFDKILNRIRTLGHEAFININYQELVIKVIDQLYDTIHTSKIDELVSEQCASMSSINFDYGKLASRILVSNHQKNTSSDLLVVVNELYNNHDFNSTHTPLVSNQLYEYVKHYSNELNQMIEHDRDYLFDYFAFKTLERAYLLKKNKKIIERPQHMWMRVSLGIHANINDPNSLQTVKETYDLMSLLYFTHATPTLYNSGTPRPQLSSCFLVALEEDSLAGIYDTLKDCAIISKYSGGIGLHIHNVRANGSIIRGTNGTSEGIIPMLRVFNNTARYANQGGKRKGSFAVYLEPWHADIVEFLELKRNQGSEELRARDLFYALWIPDLFMERIKKDSTWSLFSEDECPGLSDSYGDEFKSLYEKYEREGKARKTISARTLWMSVLDSQVETGVPYMLYKDACNMKSNQKNLGTIKSSNLCTEIVEYSDKNETAVCNLASISLPAFVDQTNKKYNYKKLYEVTKTVTNNLNKVIDINMYPTDKTRRSNLRHRPIGSGIQGLADAFAKMDIPYHSEEARKINKRIAETMYYASLEKSNEMSIERMLKMKELGINRIVEITGDNEFDFLKCCHRFDVNPDLLGAYSTFEGSPASNGLLQFDLWGFNPGEDYDEDYHYDWDRLKESIKKYGLRNSLLIAPMPTASTSQILGNNECFEPFTNNIYARRTLAGDFIVANKYMMKDLLNLNMWNEQMKNKIIANKGSIQNLTMIPEHIRNKYKTVWEIPNKFIIDMSADRGPFICQSQSMNLYMDNPTYSKLTAMHFYSWEKGLKTGLYYLRTKAKYNAQQFTIEPENKKEVSEEEEEICEMCSA
jgi:ribonucleotide reductase alpha subunit